MRVRCGGRQSPGCDVHLDALRVGVNDTQDESSQGSSPVFTEMLFSPPAFNTARCEKLQKEKEELERRFEDEVRKLGWQQQAELQDLQERLQLQFQAEVTRLQEEHGAQLLRIRHQHQEQVGQRAGLGVCSWEMRVDGRGGELVLL